MLGLSIAIVIVGCETGSHPIGPSKVLAVTHAFWDFARLLDSVPNILIVLIIMLLQASNFYFFFFFLMLSI